MTRTLPTVPGDAAPTEALRAEAVRAGSRPVVVRATADTAVAVAESLAPLIAARSLEYERARRIPVAVTELLRESGMFALTLPRALGGLEVHPMTMVECVDRIAWADSSVGWVIMIGQGSGFLGWAGRQCGADIVARTPDPILACSLAPQGVGRVAVGVPAGGEQSFTLTGRWTFNTGCHGADWLILAFLVQRPEDEGKPFTWGHNTVRFAVVHRDDVSIGDDWRVMGLKGSGSDAVTVTEVVVDRANTFSPFFEPGEHDGPLYRMSYFSYMMTMMAGYQLGVGRRAIEELRVAAESGQDGLSITDPLVGVALLRAESSLRAARLLVRDAVDALWAEVTTAGAGDPVTRARVAAATQHAQRTAHDIVSAALAMAGPGAVEESSVLQRCWRDLTAAAQHIAFAIATERRMARAALGQESRMLHLV